MISLLVSAGANINRKMEEFGVTALHVAATLGREAVLIQLVRAGASLLELDQKGRKPEVPARAKGRDAVVSLLENGGQRCYLPSY